MSNKRKLLIAMIAGPICLSLLFIGVMASLFDLDTITSKPKAFITTHFPSMYNDAKKLALVAGSENVEAGKELGVPQIGLKLSRKDQAHFSDLYKKFNNDDYGVEFYARNNKWRKAKLAFEGDEYSIRIKAHGKNPSGHQEGEFISFSVKLEAGKIIMGANRFSLIVRSRIYTNRLLILKLAEYLGLHYLPDDIVTVKINSHTEKYFFFEKKFDNKFMEASGNSSLKRFEFSETDFESGDKSLVRATDSGPYSEEQLKRYLTSSLLEEGLPRTSFDPIISRYTNLDKAIATRSLNVKEFFDPNYIAKYDALSTVMGFVGHSYMRSNFFVYYNLANGLYYPSITRDSIPSRLVLNSSEPLEKRLMSWKASGSDPIYTFPLKAALLKDDEHRQLKYRKIVEMISQYTEIKAQQNALRTKMQAVHSYGWASPFLEKVEQFSPDLLFKNLKTLERYLSQARPVIQVTGTNNNLKVVVQPNSVSALNFSKFTISNLEEGIDQKQQINVTIKVVKNDKIYQLPGTFGQSKIVNNNSLDLSYLVNRLNMFTGVDAQTEFVNHKYVINFRVNGVDFSKISQDDLIIQIYNQTNREKLAASDIEIEVLQDEQPGKQKDMRLNPDELVSPFSKLQTQFPDINMSLETEKRLVIRPGQYKLTKDFIVPRGLKLVIEAGTVLRLGKKVALMVRDGLDVRGTDKRPVVITAIDPQKPYGTVGVLGKKGTTSNINYLHQSYGSERWVEGVFFSGGLSIHYNDFITLKNSTIKSNKADDGVNFKYSSNVIIDNTRFQDNEADQIDLDYTHTYILNSRFVNTKEGDNNGDGLDISGSKAIVTGSSFTGFNDKGISVGENSQLLILDSKIDENIIGIAVKDKSDIYLVGVNFNLNKNDIAAYMKKAIFGGGNVFLQNNINVNKAKKVILDKNSLIYQFRPPKFLEGQLPKEILSRISNIFENFELVEKQQIKLIPNYVYEASGE